MGFTTACKRLSPTQLNIAIQAFALISIFFEGYDQGVMGGVNASPNYVTEVKIGLPNGTVTNTTKQGGIVSIVSWKSSIRHREIKSDHFSIILEQSLAASSVVGPPTVSEESTVSSMLQFSHLWEVHPRPPPKALISSSLLVW